MKFILLGTGPGLPNLTQNQSGLYVGVNGKNLLFDCGEGTSQQLLKHDLAGETLDAVFISHYHPDHVSGLFMVLQMLYLQSRQKPLQVFLPERPAFMMEILQFLYTFPPRFAYPIQILDCHEAELYHEEVSSALSDHLRGYTEFITANQLPNPMNSYSFRIASEAGDLVYTSDLGTMDSIMNLVRDCHTVIADAIHPEAGQVLKLQYASVKRILLNHGISPELERALAENPLPLFEFAHEGQIYSIEQ